MASCLTVEVLSCGTLPHRIVSDWEQSSTKVNVAVFAGSQDGGKIRINHGCSSCRQLGMPLNISIIKKIKENRESQRMNTSPPTKIILDTFILRKLKKTDTPAITKH